MNPHAMRTLVLWTIGMSIAVVWVAVALVLMQAL
jgi:hypothetical protein